MKNSNQGLDHYIFDYQSTGLFLMYSVFVSFHQQKYAKLTCLSLLWIHFVLDLVCAPLASSVIVI